MSIHFVISSEHTGNKIPEEFKTYFINANEKLNSHWGYDLGAKLLAENLSIGLNSKLYQTIYSRLLVDCNRGLHRDDLFSDLTRQFDTTTKYRILKNYYYPHRKGVEQFVSHASIENTVIHLSVHTFTPIWKGIEREVDIGLLFDEIRTNERDLCDKWKIELQKILPEYKIRHNEPYEGAPDGLTAHLRKIFPNTSYLGIEIEVNQKYANTDKMTKISRSLIQSLKNHLKNSL